MGNNVTKKNLVMGVSTRTGMPATAVQAIVDAFLDNLGGHLAARHTIELRGFGTFHVRRSRGRPGRNPRTGEPVTIPGRYVPALRYSPSLREAVERGKDV